MPLHGMQNPLQLHLDLLEAALSPTEEKIGSQKEEN